MVLGMPGDFCPRPISSCAQGQRSRFVVLSAQTHLPRPVLLVAKSYLRSDRLGTYTQNLPKIVATI